MSHIFESPLLCPLRVIWQSDKLPSNSTANLQVFNSKYNSKSFDSDFALRLIKSYQQSNDYIQPYQQSDTIIMQWLGDDSTLANYQYARFLDRNGNVFLNKSVSVVQEAATYLSGY